MQVAEELTGEVAALAAMPCPAAALDDRRLLEEAEAWERLGRLADARRTVLAGEIAWRSRDQIGEASLAKREGQRDAVDLLAHELRISAREAKRRIALGLRLRSRVSLQGEELPGRWAHVAAALQSGAIGVDAARVIVDALAAVSRRADAAELQVAEAALVESALSMSADLLRVQAEVWQAALDPDGAKPAEDAAHANRSVEIGREGADGITTTILKTEPEVTALLKAALNARRRGVQWIRKPADDCDEDLEWHEGAGDQRGRAQFDHDALIDIIRAGVRAADDEAGASSAGPTEVVVVVKASDLETGRGCGWADGIAGRISIPTVRRLQCSGATRLAVIGDEGEVLHLGHAKRLFTRAQRRALAVRDGGCAWPGCSAPVAWTEAHHIAWVGRDHGVTDIENGVLLCSFHHHRIHSSDEWEIRIHDRAPYLVPRRWRGAPLPRHRMQRHRLHQAGDPPGRAA